MIGKILKYMRKEKKYKQEIIAKKLGIERSSLSSYESGRRQPDFNTIEKIANTCGYKIYFISNNEKFESKDLIRKDI